MEKNITKEIIGLLMTDSNHVRGLAKQLKTNHVTVKNKLEELVDLNVVDFEKKGRNKVYYIKDTIEARNYLYITELYKLNTTIKKYPVLRKIVHDIREIAEIKLAILYGSYAKGNATQHSDIDIFAETTDRKIRKALEQINSRLSVKIGNFSMTHPLGREIDHHHVIIKGFEEYYEKKRASAPIKENR